MLTAPEQARWTANCSERPHQGAGGGLTLAEYFDRIDTRVESANERGQAILEALLDQGERIAPPADSTAPAAIYGVAAVAAAAAQRYCGPACTRVSGLPSTASAWAPSSLRMSASDNCGRSILTVNLFSFAVNVNGGL